MSGRNDSNKAFRGGSGAAAKPSDLDQFGQKMDQQGTLMDRTPEKNGDKC
ncbi:hypothetical protein [Brevibacillus dissolubilis]|nr:hypothetical protein [Brevibacillus dissolubilis]